MKNHFNPKSKLLQLTVFFVLFASTLGAQNRYLSFTQGEQDFKGQSALPERIVKNNNENGVEITFKFTGATISAKEVKGNVYNYLHVEGIHKMGQVGAPALPAKNEIIAMPKGAKGKIVILEANYKEYKGYNIHPALEPARDTEGAPEPQFQKNQAVYSKNEFFPKKVVEITHVGLNRGTGLASTEVRPVQFNPVTKTIRVYTKIRFKVEFTGGVGSFDYIAQENSLHYTNLLKLNVINSDAIPNGIPYGEMDAKSSAKNYILITHSQYLTQANELAEWKRQLGYSVEVVSASSWTASAVKDSIYDRYTSWTPKPDYFLILGDHSGSYAVPGEIHQTNDSPPEDFATDLYFACMDGTGDWHPDMAHGRIPVSSASEAQVVVDKIVNYEKTPPTPSTFYQNGLNCAQYQDDDNNGYADRRFCHTSEDIRDYLQDQQGYTAERIYYTSSAADVTTLRYNNDYYSNGGLLPAELRDAAFDWSGGSSDITTSIDNGKFYVFHRDHGYTGGSGWAHPYYTTSTMTSLSNGDLLPVVFSINCHTGEYQLSNCFAEKFLRMSGKGAVGVVGAAYYSLSGYNDALAIGMIDAIWATPGLYPVLGSAGSGANYTIGTGNEMYTMGDIVNQGLYAMEQNVSWSSSRQYQYELFHYFGDPAMKIWTANPNLNMIMATHDAGINCSNNSFSITNSTSGALATLVHNNELIGQVTLDASGKGDISYSLSSPGDVTLTISKHNCKPYVTTITQICTGYPPALNTDSAIAITDTEATLYGTITNDYGEIVTESGFVYGTDPDPTIGGAGVTQVQTSPTVTMGSFNESISGLQSSTTYYFKAYAINANGTNYGNQLSFTTLCGVASLPFAESFDDAGFPSCWTQFAEGGATDRWSVSNSNNAGGSAYEMMAAYESIDPATARLISPAINTTGVATLELSFKHFFNDYSSGATIKIQSSNDGINWTDETWSYSSGSGDAGPETITTSITNNLNSASTYIAFTVDGDLYNFDYWYIDDVEITESCTPPLTQATNFSVDATNDNDATISWTRGDGDHVLVVAKESGMVDMDPVDETSYTANSVFGSGDEMGSGNYVVYNGTGTSVNITGLTAGTDYYFAIYEYNTTDNCYLTPALTGNATTNCLISNFPYTENFDNWTVSSPSSGCTADGSVNLEDCWENVTGDGIDLDIHSGSTVSTGTGPSGDHTSGSGNYLYAEASGPCNSAGSITTPPFDFTSLSNIDLSFWYHMYGTGIGTLSLQVSTDGGSSWSSDVWSLPGDQGNAWLQANVDLSAYAGNSNVMVRFTITQTNDYTGDIAIDDIEVKESCSPPSTQATSFGVDNINNTECTISWTRGDGNAVIVLAKQGSGVDSDPANGNSYTADANFGSGQEIGSGNFVVYNGTGTSVDITGLNPATDYYFAIYEYNTSGNCYLTPALAGNSTTTDNPPVITTNAASDVLDVTATLNAEITNDYGSDVTESGFVYSLSPDPFIGGGDVIQVQTAPTVTAGSFNEAVGSLQNDTTYYYKAYAINSSGTAYGAEQSFTTLCQVVSTFPYIQGFDAWNTSSPAVSCTKNGTIALQDCWKNLTGDDIDWDVLSGSTGSTDTGPTSDHSGSGNYLYTESSSCYNHTGAITSPTLNLSSLASAQLSFWYHMYGADMGTLSVQLSTDNGASWSTDLCSLSGNQGDMWQQAFLSLDAYTSENTVKVRFTGLTGNSYTSDMAIDDIVIEEIPSTQASAFTQTNTSFTQVDVEWTRGDGDAVLVIAKEGSQVDAIPGSGLTYSASSIFTNGDEIGNGNYVVYNGTGTSLNLTGLNAGNTYHFALFEYFSSEPSYKNPAHTGTANTNGPPSVTIDDTATSINYESADVSGDVVNDNGYAVTGRGFVYNTTGNPTTSDNVVQSGSGIGVMSETLTGLAENTTYYVRAYAINAAGTAYSNEIDFATGCASSSIPLTETFDGTGIPSCWLQLGDNCSDIWSISSTSNAGGNTNEIVATWESADPATTRLVIPALNTTGLSYVDLSFKHFLNDFGPGATIKIQTSTDLSNWTDESWSYATGNGDIGPETVDVKINNNMNSANTYIAFVIDGNLYQYDNWYIDDVSVCIKPTVQASNFTVDSELGDEVTISWTRGDGDSVLVLAKENTAVDTDPEDNTSYFANTIFGSGNELGTGNYVVYKGTNNTATITGLNPHTTYHFAVYEYTNGNFYLKPALAGNATTTMCTASGGGVEYISGVELGALSNTGTGSDGYADYSLSATAPELAYLQTYDISITNGNSNIADDLGIWIDLNQDNDFEDAGENVVCSADDGANGMYSFSIPATATLGQTIMRMRIKRENSDCGSPCGTTTYGEVEDYAVNIVESPTWTGNENTTWANANNWSDYAVPTGIISITIPAAATNQPVIESQGNECNNVSIEAGASLTIQPLMDLTVNGYFTNNGNFTIQSDATGTGSVITNGTVTGTGSYDVNLYLTAQRWWYVSSPIAGSTSDVFGLDADNVLYWWNETNTGTHGWNEITSTTTLNDLQGYAYYKGTAGATTKQFTGDINTGAYGAIDNLSSEGSTFQGYNLVGNPYPSPIHLDTLPSPTGITLTNVYPTVWFRNDENLATYNWTSGTGQNNGEAVVPNMQGFWVKVADVSSPGGIQFTNEARTHMKPHGIYKDQEENIFRLTLNSNGNKDETVIGFYDDAQDIEDSYDSEKMFAQFGANPEIYSIINGKSFAINGYSKFIKDHLAIPLGIKSTVNTDATILAENIGDFNIYPVVFLEDKQTGEMTDLNKQTGYEFALNIGVNSDRFVLHMGQNATSIKDAEGQAIDIYAFADIIYLRNNGVKGQVMVYDMLGKTVHTENIDDGETINKINMHGYTGNFVVRFVTSEGVYMQKVFVH